MSAVIGTFVMSTHAAIIAVAFLARNFNFINSLRINPQRVVFLAVRAIIKEFPFMPFVLIGFIA